jgi:hypothetical protein
LGIKVVFFGDYLKSYLKQNLQKMKATESQFTKNDRVSRFRGGEISLNHYINNRPVFEPEVCGAPGSSANWWFRLY